MNKAMIYPWVFVMVFVLIVVAHSEVTSGEEEYEMLWTSHVSYAECVSISPDGNYMVVGCGSMGDVYLFDKEGKLLWEKRPRPHYLVSKVSISLDENYIAVEYPVVSGFYFGVDGKELASMPNCNWYDKKITPDGNYKVKIDGKSGTAFTDVLFFAKTSIIASDLISKAKSAVSQLKSKGVVVAEAEELLSKAEDAFSSGDFTNARSLADQAKEKAEEISKLAAPAKGAVGDAKSAIHTEESKGFYSAEAESLLSQAEQAFKVGNYEEAKLLAKNATALALDIDQDGASNEKDFAPTIKNIYIYAGTPIALLVLAALTKVSLDVRKRRKIKRLEKQKIRREEEGRRLEYEKRIRELKAKYEQYKREGYAPNKNLEEMLK